MQRLDFSNSYTTGKTGFRTLLNYILEHSLSLFGAQTYSKICFCLTLIWCRRANEVRYLSEVVTRRPSESEFILVCKNLADGQWLHCSSQTFIMRLGRVIEQHVTSFLQAKPPCSFSAYNVTRGLKSKGNVMKVQLNWLLSIRTFN